MKVAAPALVWMLLLGAARSTAAPLPAGFAKLRTVGGGGSIWRGAVPGAARKSAIYLPQGFTPSKRYPVVYLLPGMPGSPWSYVNSLSIGALGDTLIARGQARPFIAVIPVAGPSGRYDGEWAGPWEDYLVEDVVPWVDAHLPTIAGARGRTLAGLSAGGYGAVDIALRHPLLFDRVESWGGYFRPFPDGPLHDASPSVLAAHDPRLLVRRTTELLRRRGVRFFLSSGPGHDKITPAETAGFARELRALRIGCRLELLRPQRHVWERQLAAGLRWALAPGPRTTRERTPKSSERPRRGTGGSSLRRMNSGSGAPQALGREAQPRKEHAVNRLRMPAAAAAALGAALALTGTAAAAKRPAVTPPASIAKEGQIVYCSDITYPPEEFYRGSTPVGSDVDIGTAVARRLRVKARFDNTGFDGIIAALLAKRCDAIISGMNDTAQRRRSVSFVDYLAVGQSLMVKRGNPEHIRTLADLAGRTVSVEVGTTNKQFLDSESAKLQAQGKKPITIETFAKDTDAAAALKTGKVDAYFGDSPVVAYYIAKDRAFAFGGQPINPLPVGIAVRKSDAQLRAAIQKAVSKLYRNGTMRRILAKWHMSAFALKQG